MSAPPSICFVTSDFPPIVVNGGVGTHYRLLSEALAAEGWNVHVLFCGKGDDPEARLAAPEQLAERGIRFTALEDQPPPGWASVENHGGHPHWTVMSQGTVDALEAIEAEQGFDLVEFHDWGGLGFRPIQAKRTGLALRHVPMAVKLLSSTRWQREGSLSWIPSPLELELEFAERYAFEHADARLSPSRYMAEEIRSSDWAVSDEVDVTHVFPEPVAEVSGEAGPIEELVFFGRLERRKGLELFLDALERLPPEIPAVFLGRDTEIEGRQASDVIRDRLQGRPHRVELDLFGEDALRYLATGRRLAVIPSYTETFGFTVAECIANRIPFVASRVGAIPELLPHPEAQRRWLFEPTPEELPATILRRLSADEAEERALRTAAQEQAEAARWKPGLVESYERILERHRPPPSRRTASRASVTVGVAHHDHGAYLPAALESLAAQTRSPDEVIVIDDGSSDPASLRVFAEQEARHPDWRFLRQENQGPGAARNACLAAARSDYFLPFDSDNVARPSLVDALATAVESEPELDAVSCHMLAFETDADRDAGRFAFRYSPTGGPLLYALLGNVYGDACALFRAEALRSVGGFETDESSPEEDWETFIKMAVKGLQIDVVPGILMDYRDRSEGRLNRLTRDPREVFLRRRRVLDTFFVDAPLTRSQRRELWECLLGFNHLVNALGKETLVRHVLLEEALDRAQGRIAELEAATALPVPARHRVADRVHALLARIPGYLRLARAIKRRWARPAGRAQSPPGKRR